MNFPKSHNDTTGLFHQYPNLVLSIKSSSIEPGTTKYIGNIINYSAPNSWWCSDAILDSHFIIKLAKPLLLTSMAFSTLDFSIHSAHHDHPIKLKIETSHKGHISDVSSIETGLSPSVLSKTFPSFLVGPIDSIKVSMPEKNYIQNNNFCLSKFDVFGIIQMRPCSLHLNIRYANVCIFITLFMLK